MDTTNEPGYSWEDLDEIRVKLAKYLIDSVENKRG